jgi:hypothetical protein
VVDEPGDEIPEAPDEGSDTVESSAVSYVLDHISKICLMTRDTVHRSMKEGGQIVITGGISAPATTDNSIGSLDNVLDSEQGTTSLRGFRSDIYRFGRRSGRTR